MFEQKHLKSIRQHLFVRSAFWLAMFLHLSVVLPVYAQDPVSGVDPAAYAKAQSDLRNAIKARDAADKTAQQAAQDATPQNSAQTEQAYEALRKAFNDLAEAKINGFKNKVFAANTKVTVTPVTPVASSPPPKPAPGFNKALLFGGMLALVAVALGFLIRRNPRFNVLTALLRLDFRTKKESEGKRQESSSSTEQTNGNTNKTSATPPRIMDSKQNCQAYLSEIQTLCSNASRLDADLGTLQKSIYNLERRSSDQGNATFAKMLWTSYQELSVIVTEYNNISGGKSNRQEQKQLVRQQGIECLKSLLSKSQEFVDRLPDLTVSDKQTPDLHSESVVTLEVPETDVKVPKRGDEEDSTTIALKAELTAAKSDFARLQEEKRSAEENNKIALVQLEQRYKDALLNKDKDIRLIEEDSRAWQVQALSLDESIKPLTEQQHRLSRFTDVRSALQASLFELPPLLQGFVDGLMRTVNVIEKRNLTWIDADLAALDEYIYGSAPSYGRLAAANNTDVQNDTLRTALQQVTALQTWAHQQLTKHGLCLINPAVGTEFQSSLHAAAEADYVWINTEPERHNCVAGVKRIGYEAEGKVLRRAQVKRYVFAGSHLTDGPELTKNNVVTSTRPDNIQKTVAVQESRDTTPKQDSTDSKPAIIDPVVDSPVKIDPQVSPSGLQDGPLLAGIEATNGTTDTPPDTVPFKKPDLVDDGHEAEHVDPISGKPENAPSVLGADLSNVGVPDEENDMLKIASTPTTKPPDGLEKVKAG